MLATGVDRCVLVVPFLIAGVGAVDVLDRDMEYQCRHDTRIVSSGGGGGGGSSGGGGGGGGGGGTISSDDAFVPGREGRGKTVFRGAWRSGRESLRRPL